MGGHSRIHTHTKYICEQHPCFGSKVLLLIAACGHHDPTCLDSFTGAQQCAVAPTCSSKKDAEDQSSVISRNSRLPLAILYCWKVPAAHRIQTWESLVDKKLSLRFSPVVCSSFAVVQNTSDKLQAEECTHRSDSRAFCLLQFEVGVCHVACEVS